MIPEKIIMSPQLGKIWVGEYIKYVPHHTFRKKGLNQWTLFFTVAGKGFFNLNEVQLRGEAGDIIMYKPDVLHDYGTLSEKSPWHHFWLVFQADLDWENLLKWPIQVPGILKITLNNKETKKRITHLFQKIIELAFSDQNNRERFALNRLEEILLWIDTVNSLTQIPPQDNRVKAIQAFINENLTQPLNRYP